jgi:O-antigen/teichoic acid export membrane protein
MSVVAKNTIANYAGQAWSALMGIAFVPVYIRYIGIEAYGVIGFFVALQSLFTILDLGLSAALNRELALRSSGGAAAETRDLVRTLEWIYWPTGAVIAFVVWAMSGLLAEQWLHPVSLSVERTAAALMLLGLSLALQWPVSFYTGGLAGLQRQVEANLLLAVFATLRGGGVVLVLWLVAPTIEAFLWWQVIVSALQSAVYALVTWRVLPPAARTAAFSSRELGRVGRFAAGITGIAVLSFLLTQTDRIVLSKILPLDAFGVYAFAASLAYALLRLVYPISTAVYPRYSQLVATGDDAALADFYHRSNQVMAAAVLPAAATVAIFARDLVRLWTGDAALAEACAPMLALLIAGTAANGLMNLPYSLQLAHGWTGLAFRINVASVCILVPTVWILGRAFGGAGAAAAWLALNLGYVAIAVPLMHRRLLRDEMRRWYSQDIGPPAVASVAAALAWRMAVPEAPAGAAGWAVLGLAGLSALGAAVAATPASSGAVRRWWRRSLGND